MEHLSSPSEDISFGLPPSTPNKSISPAKALRLQNTKPLPTPSVQDAKVITISPSNSTGSKDMVEYPGEISPHESVVSSNQVDFFLRMAQNCAKKSLLSTALEYYSRALRIENRAAATSNKDRLLMADILFEIASIHLKQNDPFRSLYTLDLCQSIRRQLLKWDDERNAVVLHQQARIYTMVGDSESAVKALEELLGILCCSPDTNVLLLRQTWLELGRHQDKMGLHAEAESSRDEANQL